MGRKALDEGGWFDPSTSEKFEEATYWDGNNNISCSAGKFNHEALYRTKSGRWVLNWYSQWQGSRESYREISSDDACKWLITNDESDAAEKYCSTVFAEMEA